jgi:hypothetical protein
MEQVLSPGGEALNNMLVDRMSIPLIYETDLRDQQAS